jgi:hypothetical protein
MKNLGVYILSVVLIFFISTASAEEKPAVSAEEKLAAPTEEEPAAPAEEKSEIQQLRERIGELEEQMQGLKEEAEARKALAITEEEEKSEEETVKEILDAARERRTYTLIKDGILVLGYDFSYTLSSGDVLRSYNEAIAVETQQQHGLSNTLTASYGMKDNLTSYANLPILAKYDKIKDIEETSVGDISLGLRWQPFKKGATWPSAIFSGSFKTKTGSSPYQINPEQEISTGSGYYSISGSISMSKVVDPVLAFGNLGYTYAFTEKDLSQKRSDGSVLQEVDIGDSVSLGLGFGYALSYEVSLSFQVSMEYQFPTTTRVDGKWIKGISSIPASFVIGTSWRLSPKTSLSVSLSYGLSSNAPNFSLSFGLPFDFII